MEDVLLQSIDAEKCGIHDLYLDLLEQTLTGLILKDPGYLPSLQPVTADMNPELRRLGMDWPLNAQTMIGIPRLRNLRRCISQVIVDNIPGDFIETGVWRGGACIYMRANLALHNDNVRRVWVADSFAGLPPPDDCNFPLDAGAEGYKIKELAIPLDEVKANFAKYNMLDNQVVFLKGFFRDTLSSAPIDKLAILRLDGDLYESTTEALNELYHKLSRGGFVIVDDYSLPRCRQAIEDFRFEHQIKDLVEEIDHASVFWRKT